jgi:hypothetical protein
LTIIRSEPIYGYIPPSAEQADSAPETMRMDCDTSATVGDLVRLNLTIPNKIDVAIDNLDSRPIIGVIKSKITTTYCSIYVRGVLSKTVGIGRLYLSTSGDFTNIIPTSDYYQILGYSYGNGKIHFEPSLSVTKLS